MSDDLAFPYEDLWYIKLINANDKNPDETWGGYSQDYEDAENVYSHDEVLESDHEYWGIVGIKDVEHTSRSLLIFDLDIHKAPDGFDADRAQVSNETALVKSQSGGFHVSFVVTNSERGSGKGSDFQMTSDPGWDIDIRGSYVSHHVVAPNAIPGVGGKYELVRDAPLRGVLDPGDAAARITLDGEPLLEHDRAGGGATVEIDRNADPPEEMPTCYHRGLQVRKKNPDDPNVNTHQVNTLTALCGLAAGYDIGTMVEHFCDDFAPGKNADAGKTRYQLKTMAGKMDRESLAPPAISTLREYGILDEGETCNCDIEYHGMGGRTTDIGDGGQTDDNNADSSNWRGVQELYAAKDKGAGRYTAAEVLEKKTHWMDVLEEDRLWVYDEDSGVFSPWGERRAAELLESGLGQFYSSKERREVVDRLKARNQVRLDELNGGTQPGYHVCVGNGVVDLETGEIGPHSPEYRFTRGLKWDYDPETADTEAVLKFLDDVTRREADRDTIIDHLAHGLMPGHPFRAFVIMYGSGSNGKTQLQDMIEGFVGSDNAAGVKLSALAGGDDFATGALPGKMVNIGDDESMGSIRDTSTLKSLTGGGTMRANAKHEKQYEFKNEAAMFFSANEPPRIGEEKEAINNRLYPIEMPYQFNADDEYEPENPLHKRQETGISDRLVNDEAAMMGLLQLCVDHAQDLIESNGQYSMPEGPAERRLLYEAASDPIKRFLVRCIEEGSQSDAVLKDDAYDVYTTMCEADNERAADANTFKTQVSQEASVDLENWRTRSLSPGEQADPAWRYAVFADEAGEYMAPRLKERYFSEVVEEDVTDDSETEDGEEIPSGQSVYGAVPIAEAAESLTGYVTVTVEIATTNELGNKGAKAIAKDASGAIDVVAWDEPYISRLQELEGEHVAVKNAEVDDYEEKDKRQLVPVEGLTEVVTIQKGVGHTEGPDAPVGQGTLDKSNEAAADGGTETTVPDDAEGPQANARRLRDLLDSVDVDDPIGKAELIQKADTNYNMNPEKAQAALDKAVVELGIITETADGYTGGK